MLSACRFARRLADVDLGVQQPDQTPTGADELRLWLVYIVIATLVQLALLAVYAGRLAGWQDGALQHIPLASRRAQPPRLSGGEFPTWDPHAASAANLSRRQTIITGDR